MKGKYKGYAGGATWLKGKNVKLVDGSEDVKCGVGGGVIRAYF
jgi:hypothetical protein